MDLTGVDAMVIPLPERYPKEGRNAHGEANKAAIGAHYWYSAVAEEKVSFSPNNLWNASSTPAKSRGTTQRNVSSVLSGEAGRNRPIPRFMPKIRNWPG